MVELLIKNRPFEHYFLSIFSLILKGKKEIVLKAKGSRISRTIDLANILSREILPENIEYEIKTDVGKSDNFEISNIFITLRVK